MGGKCSVCGYNKSIKALEFHHIVPDSKTFGMSALFQKRPSWKVILKELKKCKLVCSNCHREIEEKKAM